MSSRGDDIVLLCATENLEAIVSTFSDPVRRMIPSTGWWSEENSILVDSFLIQEHHLKVQCLKLRVTAFDLKVFW
jgi:hypothetical protein